MMQGFTQDEPLLKWKQQASWILVVGSYLEINLRRKFILSHKFYLDGHTM